MSASRCIAIPQRRSMTGHSRLRQESVGPFLVHDTDNLSLHGAYASHDVRMNPCSRRHGEQREFATLTS